MAEEKQFTADEELIIYEAVQFLLEKADIAAGFSRDGLINELREQNATPCLRWANKFHRCHPNYSIKKLRECYQAACLELVEYFNQD